MLRFARKKRNSDTTTPPAIQQFFLFKRLLSLPVKHSSFDITILNRSLLFFYFFTIIPTEHWGKRRNTSWRGRRGGFDDLCCSYTYPTVSYYYYLPT